MDVSTVRWFLTRKTNEGTISIKFSFLLKNVPYRFSPWPIIAKNGQLLAIRHARKEVVDIRHLYTQQCHTQKITQNKKEGPGRKKLSHLSRSAAKSRWNLVCIILWMEQMEETKRREKQEGQKTEKNYKRRQTKLQKYAWNRRRTTKRQEKQFLSRDNYKSGKWGECFGIPSPQGEKRRNKNYTNNNEEKKINEIGPYVSSTNKIKNKIIHGREREKKGTNDERESKWCVISNYKVGEEWR